MRPGTCKHFTGDFHNTHCAAGVCYRDVTPEPYNDFGRSFRLPCHSTLHWSNPNPKQVENFSNRGTCDKYREPTTEELRAHELLLANRVAQFEATIPLINKIKREHAGTSWKGIETCPVCGGKLHMTHAALNGHVWGACATGGCVSWIE